MKKWRLEASKVNAEATLEANKKRREDARKVWTDAGLNPDKARYEMVKVTHRGRANRKVIETKAPLSKLMWSLIQKSDIRFVRSKKEIQAEIDRINAEEAAKVQAEAVEKLEEQLKGDTITIDESTPVGAHA